jgi:hypothetical protein
MQDSRRSFASALLIAVLAIAGSHAARAQDMPPIFAPLAPTTPPAAPAVAPAVSPSAEAAIPPAPPSAFTAPARQEHTASAGHATAHHNAKPASIKNRFAALTRRLTGGAHTHRSVSHVVNSEPQPVFPPGAPIPPPGYFPPSPYRQLVYGGPPRPPFGGWGRYPY